MPELRKDPVIGRWVIIATERAKRPDDFAGERGLRISKGFCPFCVGNEGKTPPEVYSVREWRAQYTRVEGKGCSK